EPPDDGIAARQASIVRRIAGVALTVYWLTLFTATHIPVRDAPVQFPGADKVAHFVGYGTLGLLLSFYVAMRRPWTMKVALVTVLAIAAYGAIDELLQIPVGRTCELADWMFDVLGASVGGLVITVL